MYNLPSSDIHDISVELEREHANLQRMITTLRMQMTMLEGMRSNVSASVPMQQQQQFPQDQSTQTSSPVPSYDRSAASAGFHPNHANQQSSGAAIVPTLEHIDLTSLAMHQQDDKTIADLLQPLPSEDAAIFEMIDVPSLKRKTLDADAFDGYMPSSFNNSMSSFFAVPDALFDDSEDDGHVVDFPVEPSTKRRRIAQAESVSSQDRMHKISSKQEHKWEVRFQELIEYANQHGHCSVPHCHSNTALAQWVKRQRHQYKLKTMGRHNHLTDSRQERLEAMGFCWDSHSALWEERYHEMIHYKNANGGNCSIPSRCKVQPALATWAKCQRRQYKLMQEGKKSNMTQERVDRLNAIGFVWEPRSLV